MKSSEQGIWKWADPINAPPERYRITLGEGNTPLVRSRRIGPEAGLTNLYFKLESTNPTGSYKDRFAVSAISHLLAHRKSRCLATSSGNTGASLAAACAVAGIPCHLAIVETAPEGKLKQMLAYGAELHRILGFGLDPIASAEIFTRLRTLGDREDISLEVSAFSISPRGMAGVETLAFEIDADLHSNVDHVFLPSGGGGLCLAVARGFQKCESSPAIHCVQPEGNNTIAGPLRSGRDHGQRAMPCTTHISGLQVPNLLDASGVIKACRESGGNGHLVADETIYALQKRLAREEGIFSEPAGVVALAGALQALANGEIGPDQTVVCPITGSGFKDGPSLDRMISTEAVPMVDFDVFESTFQP
jgi:threonine synthase